MKNLVSSLVLCSLLGLVSCSAKEEAAHVEHRDTTSRVAQPPLMPVDSRPTPFPGGFDFNTTYTQAAIDSILNLPISERPQTPKEAGEYYLTIPPKMGIAPPSVPAKNIRVESENDSIAVIAYEAVHNPMDARMTVFKASNGMNHAWLIRKTTVTHRQP